MSTQNDWEDEIKDMLSDAGLKPIHFMLNNSGVRILNRIREELADARKEMVEKVEQEIPRYLKGGKIRNQYFAKGHNECKRDVLAILRKETK